MCLMMGGGMDMLKPKVPKESVKPESTFWQSVLFVCTIVQLILAICMMCISPRNGISDLINALFLACACFSMDHCCLLMYLCNIVMPFG